jgi:aspartate/methionine/tyrosine aminotransferase
MRRKLLSDGAQELNYEIRDIVKKAEQVQASGVKIFWENIGDPIPKNNQVPAWIKEIIGDLTLENRTYGYCHSKGILETRQFLSDKTNALNGVQITADDVLFFNGLGDAISKVYQYLVPASRVIGPSPAYSTHSSAEAANAAADPITYRLDPNNQWFPDMEDLYNKIKYNPNIVGLLIINPDNPTGMVYPEETLIKLIEIAKEFDLFVISDEIYSNITYNGARAITLAEIIGDVPGIAMKGISKEFPWPGSRCGWLEFYNRDMDPEFNRLCNTLDKAKMIEVCSTTLPQLSIPKVMSDPRYLPYRQEANDAIGRRATKIANILGSVPDLIFNKTYGAFYNTIVFRDGVLKPHQTLPIDNPELEAKVSEWTQSVDLDKRFVYYLLASTGVCVVPISSFCSELSGFRVTLLEEDEDLLVEIFSKIKNAVIQYLAS